MAEDITTALKNRGFRVGVCYESQVVDQVPMEAHDIHAGPVVKRVFRIYAEIQIF